MCILTFNHNTMKTSHLLHKYILVLFALLPAALIGQSESGHGNLTIPAGYQASNSYMITNRANTWTQDTLSQTVIVPMDSGALNWYLSDQPLNPVFSEGDSTSQSDFIDALVGDLNASQVNDTAQLCIFVHGLGTSWFDAQRTLASYGDSLFRNGLTNGVVVGFSWPSYGDTTDLWTSMDNYSSAYLPKYDSGHTRDNIRGSEASFSEMLSAMLGIRSNSGLNFSTLKVHLIAHSEGGYMAMRGMNYISKNGTLGDMQLDQILLLAPDIDQGAFAVSPSYQTADGDTGDAGHMTNFAAQITVFYSCCDGILASSEALALVHNTHFLARIGKDGPPSGLSVIPGVQFQDCGSINDCDSWCINLSSAVHTSYLTKTKILQLETALLNSD